MKRRLNCWIVKSGIVLTLTAAGMLASCFEGKRTTGTDGQDSTASTLLQAGEALKFDTLGLHRNVAVIPGQDVPRYSIDMCMNFATGNSPEAHAVNERLCQEIYYIAGRSPEETMNHFADSLASQFGQELKEFYEPDDEDGGYRFTYTWNMTGKLNDKPLAGVLGYIATTETYQGGAHGSYVIDYLNFDAQTGHFLDTWDVFLESKRTALIDAIMKQLLADNNCKTVDELREQTSITVLGDVYVDNNFLIESDGITFLYNQYEIAPYSSGLISVTLKYEQLNGLLTPNFMAIKKKAK